MTITTEDYAYLSKDVYRDDLPRGVAGKPFIINGHSYQVIDAISTDSGYQARAYQRTDTGEVVIAERGTEPKTNDAITDFKMVRDQTNQQWPDAQKFAEHAIAAAKATQVNFANPIDITVTGHSLGGTLGELTAAKYHLKGETFNSYGAVDLGYGFRSDSAQVMNYVLAGDVVSAASRHIGTVKEVATQADIASLREARYLHAGHNSPTPNPLLAMRLSDHGIGNFAPDPGKGPSVLAAANEALYEQNRGAVDHYRSDVVAERAELGEVLRRADSRNIETTLSNLPPHLQQQLAEYHALHVDVPIQQAVEHNAAVHGAESGLGYMASETRAVGQAVQGMDERLAATARQAGREVVYVAPGAALTAEVFAEGAHLHGQATHAASEFAAGQWQSARHAVEQGAHLAGQVDTKVVHVAEAAVVRGVDAISDTYQSTRADVQALSHAAIEGAQRVEKGAAQTYTDAKYAVSQGIQATEHAASQTYDTLIHPGQGFDHTATPQPSATSEPARHQQRALHGESSQVERVQEAQRQQEIHGHAAAHEAPLPPAPAAIATGARA